MAADLRLCSNAMEVSIRDLGVGFLEHATLQTDRRKQRIVQAGTDTGEGVNTTRQVLEKEWRAPLRCRPYSKLEALNNQPEVHGGNEEYWHQKRRSVVPPKVRLVAALLCADLSNYGR